MDFSKVIKISNRIYEHWLMFVNPIYNLSQKEIVFLACLLKRYNQISSSIDETQYTSPVHIFESDQSKKTNISHKEYLVNQILFSTDSRKEIKSELGIKNNYFDVLLNKLRKHNVIVDNVIDKKIVPNFDVKGKAFTLLVYFDFKNEKTT